MTKSSMENCIFCAVCFDSKTFLADINSNKNKKNIKKWKHTWKGCWQQNTFYKGAIIWNLLQVYCKCSSL